MVQLSALDIIQTGMYGLSVEQRKRLTIAVELVANPSIVFMDEPTSGVCCFQKYTQKSSYRKLAVDRCVTRAHPASRILKAAEDTNSTPTHAAQMTHMARCVQQAWTPGPLLLSCGRCATPSTRAAPSCAPSTSRPSTSSRCAAASRSLHRSQWSLFCPQCLDTSLPTSTCLDTGC